MSDNCSAPDRICRSAVFFSRSEASEGTAAKPQRRKLGTIGGPRSSLAVAVSWSGYFSEVDFIFPFAIRQVDPPGSASRSPSSRRCHLENALREVSNRDGNALFIREPRRQGGGSGIKGKRLISQLDYGRFFGAGNGSRPSALAILRQSLPPIPGIRSNSAVGRCCRSPTTSYPVRFSSRRSQGRSFKSASFVSMPREKQTGAHRAIA